MKLELLFALSTLAVLPGWLLMIGLPRGIHFLAMAPVLWLTLLVGPIGLLAYLVLRPFVQPAAASRNPQ